jgi:WD repeat/SOCS box-containing protein 1
MGSFEKKHTDNGLEKLRLIEQLKPEQSQLSRNGSETWSVAFAPDNTYFAWSCGHRTVVVLPWNATKNRPIDSLNDSKSKLQPLIIECDDYVWSLAFGSSNNSSSDVSDKSSTELIMTPSSGKTNRFFNFRSEINQLILAVGLNNGRIRIYSVFSGRFLTELMDHKDVIRHIQFAPDNSLILLSASRDSTLKLWDMNDDGNMFRTLTAHGENEWVMCCAWSPNAKYVASGGSHKSLFVYDTNNWSVFRNLRAHHHSVVSCQFSPDSKLLVSASYDTTVIMWDYFNEQQLAVFWHLLPPPLPIYASGANDNYIRSLSFSPDGEHIATVCDDGNLRIWSIFDPRQPVASAEVTNAVCTTYSTDGFCLSVGTREGNVHLFAAPMKVQSLLQMSRRTIRMHLKSNDDIDGLPISQRLKIYLAYKLL